jgi:tRNA A-37 threonylcarbamoyl transferase component Bud32
VLHDLLLGRLSDPDAERVAARLANDPRWRALADDSRPTDPLIEAVRESARVAPSQEEPPPPDLVARLERLSSAPGQTGTWDAAGDTSSPSTSIAGGDGLSFLRPPRAPEELGRLAGFRILEVLGRGGMGLVLRAEDVQLRRQVALKVIRPERAADPSHRERFLREARAAAALQHDYVMPIHQIGEDNGVLFLAMPLLAGETLEARLARRPALTTDEQLRIGRESAEGLAAAHAAGLIHRDIKPSNVWLESNRSSPGLAGRVKVLDFGLARFAEGDEGMTQAGAVLGTPAYMSPEQADGQPVDARSDLFSLGCILYRMATGRQPFARDSVTATLRAVVDSTPAAPHEVAPDVPRPLSALILHLLAKSPADRSESADEVATALRAIQAGDSTTAQYRPAPAPRKRGCAIAIAITLTVTVLAGLVIGPGWMVVSRVKSKAPGAMPPSHALYEGYADVIVWTKAGGAPRRMRLSDDGALPLHAGDQFRIEAKVTPKAYLYLFWIDTEAQVIPIYPWAPGQWGTRPADESPRDELTLPANETKGYKITGDREGMETLLLLARPSPLDADDAAVKGWFADLQPQRPVQNPLSAVWFENGQVVQNDARRKRQWFEEGDIDDPVLRMQRLLRERLQPHAAFTSAVSFAKQGK